MTKRPLSDKHVRALAALVSAENGTLSDASLRDVIGMYATNVIASLVDRHLIRQSQGLFDDSDTWTLTSRGSLAWTRVAPASRPACCSKCGQLLPAAVES